MSIFSWMLVVRQKRFYSIRAVKVLGLSGLLATLALAGPQGGLIPPGGRHTVVISIDGLCASWYRSPAPGLKIPNILRLKNEGSFAEAVEGVYPTVTYPSHTTLVTGRLPGEHGIYTNVSSREWGGNRGDWFWFSRGIKVPALWDEARAAHLTTAAVSWPVTAGAPINWNFPEIWDPAKGEMMDFEVIGKYSTPGLLPEVMRALDLPQPGMDGDAMRANVAIYLLEKYKPNLLLLHLNNLDHFEHEAGPDSDIARATLEQLDVRIGEILAAVKEAGLSDSTDVFVVSDHGFLPVQRMINPNVLLAKAGLLTLDDKGHITGGKVFTIATAAFFVYWHEGQNLRPEVDAALKPLLDQGLVWAEFDRSALKELGVDPGVQLALEPPLGYQYGSRATGDLDTPLKTPGGAHGFFPYRNRMEASFIAWGPGIRSGVDLHRIRMTSVGPTILKAMGVDDAQFGDTPPLGDIFKPEAD